MEQLNRCRHIECIEAESIEEFCRYHYAGGVFGSGETYERYQIIEQDFIDFIKIVPLYETENLNVYSPVLRDIIIRTCVEIELFFKEWGKYDCIVNPDSELYRLYNKPDNNRNDIRKTRDWKFRHYFYLISKYNIARPLHIRDLNVEVNIFESWILEDSVPDWWQVYNFLKHDGIVNKKKVSLKITLDALTALFTLHCANYYSRKYLEQFSSLKLNNRFFRNSEIQEENISTPIDSKQYLFRDISRRGNTRRVSIPKSKDFLDEVTFKGKKV